MLRRTATALRSRIQAAAASAQNTQIEGFATAAKGKPAGKQKAANPAKQASPSGSKVAREEDSKDKKHQLLLKVLTPAEVKHEDLAPEQQAEYTKRAKTYSRRKMAEHRAWQKDLSRKIQLKEAALTALPPHLRATADQPDYTPFPADRMVPTHTPPIKGFGQTRGGRGKE